MSAARSTSTDPPQSSRLPRAVVMLGVTSFFTDASSEMILPLLPALLLGTLGASPLWLGLVDGVADALSAVLKLVAGKLSDRGRKKPWVLLGYGLSTAARPIVSFAVAPIHVVLVRALDRVGKGLRTAPRDAILSDAVVGADAPRAFAFHRMMDHSGAVVGPLVATGLLAAGFAVRDVITAAWIPGVLAFITLLFVKEPTRPVPTADTNSAAPPASSPTRTAAPRRFLFAAFLFGAATLPDTFLIVRAREVGIADALVPLVWVLLHIAKVVAAGRVARRAHTDVRLLLAGWLLVGVGALALAPASIAGVLVGAVLIGVGHGLREPLEKEVVRRAAPDRGRGGAFGAYHLVCGGASLVSGIAIGAAWAPYGAAVVLAVGAVGSIVAGVVAWRAVQ